MPEYCSDGQVLTPLIFMIAIDVLYRYRYELSSLGVPGCKGNECLVEPIRSLWAEQVRMRMHFSICL